MKDLYYCILIIFQVITLVCGNSLFHNITILDMNAEQMTCIDFDTLNQLKNLTEIKFENGKMPYFPDKDCNNPEHEEDPRPLDLPNLQYLTLKGIRLLKVPNTSLIPKLETIFVLGNPIRELEESQFINNGKLKLIGLAFNDFTSAPVITSGCNDLDRLNLNDNLLTKIPENYFSGCSIRQAEVMNNLS